MIEGREGSSEGEGRGSRGREGEIDGGRARGREGSREGEGWIEGEGRRGRGRDRLREGMRDIPWEGSRIWGSREGEGSKEGELWGEGGMHLAAIRSIITRPPCLLIHIPKGSPACNECTGRASPYNDVIMNLTSAGPTMSTPCTCVGLVRCTQAQSRC